WRVLFLQFLRGPILRYLCGQVSQFGGVRGQLSKVAHRIYADKSRNQPGSVRSKLSSEGRRLLRAVTVVRLVDQVADYAIILLLERLEPAPAELILTSRAIEHEVAIEDMLDAFLACV